MFTLKLFTDASLLRQIGRPLLTELFGRFAHLLPGKYDLPTIDGPDYFLCVARVLARGTLPHPLLQALDDIEAMATPENQPRRPAPPDPTILFAESAPLRQAIENWLAAHTKTRVPVDHSISLSVNPSPGVHHQPLTTDVPAPDGPDPSTSRTGTLAPSSASEMENLKCELAAPADPSRIEHQESKTDPLSWQLQPVASPDPNQSQIEGASDQSKLDPSPNSRSIKNQKSKFKNPLRPLRSLN